MELSSGMYLYLTILITANGGIFAERLSRESGDELKDSVTKIIDIHPSQIQYGTSSCITVKIENLAVTTETYICEFEILSSIQFVKAKQGKNGTVVCQTPPPDYLPPITDEQDLIISKLSVRSGKAVVASETFTYYNCPSYKTCTECVSSPYPCDFCLTGSRCTHDASKNCLNDLLITGRSSPGLMRKGREFCPKITSGNSQTEILFPSGKSKRIMVKVDNITFLVQFRFVCLFEVENKSKSTTAQLLGDTFYCDKIKLNLSGNATELSVPISIWAGGHIKLDNPENIHALVYSCKEMADDCHTCLNLPEKYNCGYCQGSNASCTLQEDCTTAFLRRKETCPKMVIEVSNLNPRSGPVSGGTRINIFGRNLGRGNTAKVQLGAAECKIVRRNFDEIVCVTSPAAALGSVGVTVEIGGVGNSQETNVTFEYVRDPTLDYSGSGAPRGIPNGGILNVFRGINFNFLNSTKFYVTYKDNKYESSCLVKSESELRCISPGVPDLTDEGIDPDSPLQLEYGFVTDAHPLINQLASNSQASKFLMYPKPSLESFDGLKLFVSDYLTINGHHLTPAITEDDLKIQMGNSSCVLTSLSKSQLTCRPNLTSGVSLYEVTVEIGSSLKYNIGQLARVLDTSESHCWN